MAGIAPEQKTLEDKYRNFEQLRKHEKENEDFVIEYRPVDSGILIMAPHGGGIEPHTDSLAEMIAGHDFRLYVFKGIKKTGNRVLHITSHRFDEPEALKAAGSVNTIITIHGQCDKSESVFVSGLDTKLRRSIENGLKRLGFTVKASPKNIAGRHPQNICNLGGSKKGVQLELSAGLRKLLCSDSRRRDDFVESVRAALRER